MNWSRSVTDWSAMSPLYFQVRNSKIFSDKMADKVRAIGCFTLRHFGYILENNVASSLTVLEAKATGNSCPSLTWSSTAPKPYADASVSQWRSQGGRWGRSPPLRFRKQKKGGKGKRKRKREKCFPETNSLGKERKKKKSRE